MSLLVFHGIKGKRPIEGWSSEAQAVFNEMTTDPSLEQKGRIDDYIKYLKDGGVWSKLDVMYLFAGHTNTGGEALINIKNPGTFNATLVNSPSFSAYQGFTGDGSTSYINTNWSPGGDGVNFTQNSASIGYHCNTALTGSSSTNIYGAYSGGNYIRCWPRYTTDVRFVRINYTGNNLEAAGQTDTTGLFADVVTSSTTQVSYRNASSIDTGSDTTTGVPDSDMYVLAGNISGAGGWTPAQVGLFFAGASLTQIEVGTIVTAYNEYLAGVSTGGWETESETLFNAMTTEPDNTHKGYVNTLIKALKDNNLWSKIDVAYLLAGHTNAASEALINIKNPGTNDATAVNSPTFTQYEGFTGNGWKRYECVHKPQLYIRNRQR
jgi:hypothetical protein